jgi:1-acyl-sn-glycerol-3-phosphate acyltransferase
MSTLVLTFWIWVPLTLLIDTIRGTTYYRAFLFVANYFLFQFIGLGMLLHHWLRYRWSFGHAPGAFVDSMHQVQRHWADLLWRSSVSILKLRVVVENGYEFGKRRILFATRHVSIGDTFLPLHLVLIPYDQKLGFVMKKELEWDPCIDVAVSRFPHIFITRKSDGRDTEISQVGDLINHPKLDGVVIFPEGTRFTPKKREQILQSLEASGRDELLEWTRSHERVLPPRPGGFLRLLERNQDADVVFCAHHGFENARTFADILNGAISNSTIHVKMWAVPYDEIPTSNEERLNWIMDQWSAVDQYISEQAETN